MEESLVTAPPAQTWAPFPMPHLGGFPFSREGAQDLSHRGRGLAGATAEFTAQSLAEKKFSG